MLLAAAGPSALFLQLGAIFVVLAVLSRFAGRLGISAVPLFLLVGLAIGEGGVHDAGAAGAFLATAAPIGVVLLLLFLGLEYTPQELLAGIRQHAPAGAVDLVLNVTPGALLGLVLGWGGLGMLVLGGVTYISSSGIIAKALDELERTGNRETPTILTILVVEDLVMAAYLPLLAGVAVGGGADRAAVTTIGALAAALFVFLFALRFSGSTSWVLNHLEEEPLLLAVLGLTFVVAGGAESVQVSGAIGAFLTGIAITGRARWRTEDLLRPLRDVFGATFFVYFAFQINPRDLPDALPLALGLAVVSAGTKIATGWWAASRAGIAPRGRLRAGTMLVTRGEFSIVIAEIGVLASVDDQLAPLAAAYVLLLAIGGPILSRFSDDLAERFVPAPSVS
jgi:CPA2 family monovalent cation:H+ antiporter-2